MERRANLERLQAYARVIHEVGGPATVFGFVDGTLRGISRPGGKDMDQKLFYSGYKKLHAVKYQGLATPDGLVSSIYGPVVGKTGDYKLWLESGLSEKLRTLMGHLPAGERLLVYGDAAYKAGAYGLVGAKTAPAGGELSSKEREYNKAMSSFRIVVENAFGIVSNKWRANGFTMGLRAGSSQVGSIYLVSVLLTNCLTCIRGGNQVSSYYSMEPPSLASYLGMVEQPDLAMEF